ncbi:MAG: sulfurtransferase, partial [Flavobacteriaceae bacterium]
MAPKPGVGDKVAGNGYRNPTALIGVAELARRMEDYRLIDFRKREAYENGHIMGALQMWRTDIEDGSKPYRGIMAQKGELEELFSKKGIHSDDTLIIYDDNGGCDAARLWWVLYQYGFYNCR